MSVPDLKDKAETMQPPSEQKPEANPLLSFTWWKIVLSLLIIVLVPLVWLVGARVLGDRIDTGSALLAIIGGLMGAVFTVGGLVIALVALLTQVVLMDRVKNAIAEAKAEVKQENAKVQDDIRRLYTNDLRPELLQRARQQVLAQNELLRADLALKENHHGEAVARIEEAIAQDPDLEYARSRRGHLLTQIVLDGFWKQHGQRISMGPEDYPQLRPLIDIPTLDAIEALQDAIAKRDVNGGEAISDLSLMYAVIHDYARMIETMQHAVSEYPDQRAYLAQESHLITFAYACGNASERLHELGELLEVALPTPLEEVIASATNLSPLSVNVQWYFVENEGYYSRSQEQFPLTMTILVSKPEETVVGYAHYFVQGKLMTITEDGPSGDRDHPYVAPIPDLVHFLGKRFAFICQHSAHLPFLS